MEFLNNIVSAGAGYSSRNSSVCLIDASTTKTKPNIVIY